METPPRAWGRPYTADKSGAFFGNTPTSVGKTPVWQQDLPLPWKHPHERGEDRAGMATTGKATETPPRAWGRPEIRGRNGSLFRNTPTSVGKTSKAMPDGTELRKHPHERGEDDVNELARRYEAETPPRAWGRPGRLRLAGAAVGNTPTSVGKTTRPCSCASRARKHPHERGEDFPAFSSFSSPAETPPRAWGRPATMLPGLDMDRNTPTSVGKTGTSRNVRK